MIIALARARQHAQLINTMTRHKPGLVGIRLTRRRRRRALTNVPFVLLALFQYYFLIRLRKHQNEKRERERKRYTPKMIRIIVDCCIGNKRIDLTHTDIYVLHLLLYMINRVLVTSGCEARKKRALDQ